MFEGVRLMRFTHTTTFPDPRERVVWVDVLKAVAAFAVVMTHVASIPWQALEYQGDGWLATSFYETATRFAVPVFFAISGFFLLNPKRNITIGKLYKRYLPRAFAATAAASILFVLLQQALHGWLGWRQVLSGAVDGPYFIWYMWTLMTLYVITPLLMPIASNEKLLNYALVVLFCLGFGKYTCLALAPDSIASLAFSNLTLVPIEVESLFCYLLGAWIASHALTRRGGGAVIMVGFLAFVLSLYLNSWHSGADLYYVARDNVLIVVFSIGVLVLFAGRKFNRRLSRIALFLSSYALWIYLVHPFVRELFESLPMFSPMKQWLLDNTLVGIPVVTTLVYLFTLLLSVTLKWGVGKVGQTVKKARGGKRGLGALAIAAGIAFCLTAVNPLDAHAAQVSTIAGVNRFETAAKAASQAYPSGCNKVIIAGSEAWADALSGAGLAGALDSPILFTEKDGLPSETSRAIATLGASEIVLLGSPDSVSVATAEQIRSLPGVQVLHRVGGDTRYDTQLAVYNFGKSEYDGIDHWRHDLVICASGENFPDALSASPLAFAQAAPVFLVDATGKLSAGQEDRLLSGSFGRAVVMGSSVAVDDSVVGYLEAVTAFSSDRSLPNTVRLGGADRFETSALFARWCVGEGYLSWDNAAFVSSFLPFDALAGSVVQGKKRSVLLLAGDANSSTIAEFARQSGSISHYTFFGSTAAVSDNLRSYISFSLQFGYALPAGGTRISDGSYIWCDSSGVYRQDNVYYRSYIDKANRYGSLTSWLILVDTVANRTLVMSWGVGTWVVEKDFLCTTGAWRTPTVKGQFTVGLRGISFGSGYTCWYWTQFYGDYLFHSVLYQPGSMSRIQDGRLGINASHGCVRLDLANAKWIYDTIPSRSKVVVF